MSDTMTATAQSPAPPAPPRGLAITGLVLAVLLPPVGLIVSIIAGVKLKRLGAPRGLAVTGIVIGAVLTLIEIVIVVVAVLAFSALFSTCAELGPGVWEVGGTTYTCG